MGFLDNKSDCSLCSCLIYEAIVKKKKNLKTCSSVSSGVLPLILSGNVGRRPSKLPEGISVGSVVNLFSLFIVQFYTSGVRSCSLFYSFLQLFFFFWLFMEYKYFIPAKKVRGQFRAWSIKLKQMQIEYEEIPEGSRRYLFFKTG